MSENEFIKSIENLGFIFDTVYEIFVYKDFEIFLYDDCYDFHNGEKWIYDIPLNDLTIFNRYLKKEFRSIKLKKILR